MSAFKFRECKTCSFHDVEPAICELCNNGSEYQDKLFDEDVREALSYFREDLGIE